MSAVLGAVSGLYDKYLMAPLGAGGVGLNRMTVQSYFSFYQCAIMGVMVLLLWYPQRRRLTPFHWAWSIPLISLFLSVADFVYFYSLSLDGALISVVSMVRRSSVMVSFLVGAMVFHEKNLRKDIWVGGSLTTREYNSKYNVIYANPERTFFSYRAEGDFYTGGAHGSSAVLLGSIDLKSGRKLRIDDVIPADKRAEALSLVKDAVVKKLEGADKLQGKVTLTENFCIAEDGLHFLFQEYEIAAYCFGSIEVIIPAYGEYRRSDGQRRSTR